MAETLLWTCALSGAAVKDVHDAFNTHFAAQNPQAAAVIADADKAWGHYVRLRQAGSSTAVQGMEGNYSPTQLAMAAKSQDKTLGKRAMSEGDALYQEITQTGKTILPSKVADSGTPERTAALGLLGYAALQPQYGVPLVGGLAAGNLAYSRPAQTLIRALMNAGPRREATADAVRRYGPLAAAMGAHSAQQ